MKKTFVAVLGVLVVLVAAVFVLPGFIDWNDYRGEIARQAEELTGRKLTIGGDIEITLLPAPALVAQDVRLANIGGAAVPDMARVKSLEIRLAFVPLLGGNFQVETIRMIEPVIDLERLADGRANWDFEPAGGKPGVSAPGSASAPSPDGSGAAVSLENFRISDGTVVYRNGQTGYVERIESVNAQIAAESLSGPLDSAGSLVLRGMPLDYRLAVSRVIEGRTVPLNMVFESPAGTSKAELSGAIYDLGGTPRFKGKMVASGEELSGLIDGLSGAGTAPAALRAPFRIDSEVTATAESLDMKDAALSLGSLGVGGAVKLGYAEGMTFDAKLTANRIDLDALLAPAPASGTAGPSGGASFEVPRPPAKDAPADEARFTLPADISGNFDLTVPAVSYRNGVISNVHVDAGIGGGEITISQLSAQLPGGSEVFATGFVTAEQGQPKFDGNLDCRFSNLRRILDWLDVEIPGVPSDRLRKVDFKGRVTADAKQIQGTSLNVTVDTSTITGGITWALRKRVAFGAALKVDRVNLDAYLNGDAAVSEGGTETGNAASRQGGDAATRTGQAGGNPLAFLHFLRSFDANLRLEVGHLTYRRLPIQGLEFDGTLVGGGLDIRRLGVADFADANGNVTGKLVGLNDVPGAEKLQFDLREVDVSRLLRQFEVDPPIAAGDLGIAQVTGQVDGSLLRPDLDLVFKTADASVDLDGKMSVLPLAPLFDGTVKVRHADFVQFLRLLGVDYRPSGHVDGLALSTHVKGGLKSAAFDDLAAKVGTVDVKGSLKYDGTGARPRIDADLQAGPILIDPFLPAQSAAYLDTGGWTEPPRKPRVIPASWQPDAADGSVGLQLAAAAGAGIWSDLPLHLGFLQAFDAGLKLTSPDITKDKVSLKSAVLEATVENGVLGLNSLTGKLFGGDLTGSATLRSGPKVGLDGAALLTNGDFGQAERAFSGSQAASGTIGGRITFSAQGASEAELVSSLGGEGSFSASKVSVKSGGNGPLGPISALLSALDALGGSLLGDRAEGQAEVSGSFKIENGVAKSDDLAFATTVGDGKATGTADLPNWRLDLTGDVALSQNLVSKLLSTTTGAELVLPLRIKGPLDEPRVIIETKRLPGNVLKIPGQVIEKTLDRTGLGNVLKKLLPAQ